MSDYVANKWYENIPEYKGIDDNLIKADDDFHVQRWKWEQQQAWVQANTKPTQGESLSNTDNNSQPFTVNTLSYNTTVGAVLGLDDLHSGNGSNLIPLKRMELIYKDIDLKFAVNPSDYTQKEPNRVNLTQTKGGAWIDAWGAGIVEFNIKGITGVYGSKFHASKDNYFSKLVNTGYDIARVLSGDNGVDVGYQRWKEMRDLFRKVYSAVEDGEEVKDFVQFYNFTDNEYWYCYPSPAGIELYRSKSKPHVYQYTINLWGLRRIGDPEITLTVGVIGNPAKVDPTSPLNNPIVDTSKNTGGNVSGNNAEGQGYEEASGEASEDRNVSNTSKDTKREYKASPNPYVSALSNSNTQVDTFTVTNTRTKSNESLRTQSKQYVDLLAPIIGGSNNGLLVPTTAYGVAKDLAITSIGAVLHINAFNQNNFIKNPLQEIPENRLIQEINFTPTVSSETYKLWKSIRDYSPEVLDDSLINPGTLTAEERILKIIKTVKYYGSTLYEYILQYKQKYYLTRTDIKYLELIMIETMNVYVNLYKIYLSTDQIATTLSLSSIKTLIQNIQSIILYLEFNSTNLNTFYLQNIKWELRQIETILHQVKTDIIEYL